nr:YcnI family protein [Corynebacterium lactis]
MPLTKIHAHDQRPHRSSRRSRTAAAVASASMAASAAAMLAFPAVASAHVHAKPDSATIGGYADLAFGVPHGCDGSSTTKVEFTIPAEFEKVTPNVNPNWTIEKATDGEGKDAAVKKVTYTAKTPLPSDQRDTLTLSVKVADSAKAGTVLVPTVQTCEKGSVEWTSANHDDKHPAPTVELLAKGEGDAGHDHGHDHGDHTTAGHGDGNHSTEAQVEATGERSNDAVLGAWGLGLGALGALTGIAALVISLRKKN